MNEPVVPRGRLGWGNRKGGYEAYGPGGRWNGDGAYAHYGDLLGDALERVGATEGATLVVVAIPRFYGGQDPVAQAVEEAVHRALSPAPAPAPGDRGTP